MLKQTKTQGKLISDPQMYKMVHSNIREAYVMLLYVMQKLKTNIWVVCITQYCRYHISSILMQLNYMDGQCQNA